jgi:hypothetical protein
MEMKKSLWGLLVVGICLFGAVGCTQVEDVTVDVPDDSDKTVITYQLSPEQATYSGGDDVTIQATFTGPDVDGLDVSWGFNSNGLSLNGLPSTTETRWDYTLPNGPGTFIVTAGPSMTQRRNGVELIEGSVTYNIVIE